MTAQVVDRALVEIPCPDWCVSDHASDGQVMPGDYVVHHGPKVTIAADERAASDSWELERSGQTDAEGEIIPEHRGIKLWLLNDALLSERQAIRLRDLLIAELGTTGATS